MDTISRRFSDSSIPSVQVISVNLLRYWFISNILGIIFFVWDGDRPRIPIDQKIEVLIREEFTVPLYSRENTCCLTVFTVLSSLASLGNPQQSLTIRARLPLSLSVFLKLLAPPGKSSSSRLPNTSSSNPHPESFLIDKTKTLSPSSSTVFSHRQDQGTWPSFSIQVSNSHGSKCTDQTICRSCYRSQRYRPR